VHPAHALYIFGPEDGSISQSIIDRADDVVYVPTVGCMNLAASVNVLLYDRLSKAARTLVGNQAPVSDADLIKTSRDVNNRLNVNRQ
jgi:tRNA C32,U32 (ribose-2'-O)-methylase TrmJ